MVLLNLRTNSELKEPNDQICAIKEDVTLKDYGIQFDIIDVAPYDGCTSISNQSFNNKAVFIRFNDSSPCSLDVILGNLEENNALLAVIGLNGSIVRTC